MVSNGGTQEPGGGEQISDAHPSEASPPLQSVPGGEALLRLTNALSLVGGALLLVAVGITVVSVIGRYSFSSPVPGDYELVEIVCAIAIFLFFPMTHATDGNLRAEFFTTALPLAGKRVLEITHDLIYMAIAGLLSVRMSHALFDKLHSGEVSIFLRIPLWIPLTVAVASMALVAVVCALRIVASAGALRK